MKRLNNNGFAISTLLYGLSIMGFLVMILLMSIMSTNRENSTNFVNQIEAELNRLSLSELTITPTNPSMLGASQDYYIQPGQSGMYKIELWGASGGDNGSNKGGKGAYTSGTIYLEEDTHIYVYIGGKGASSTGGKNGGSASGSGYAGGGGATDVRIVTGDAASSTSYNTRIMVAAGGGGAKSSAAGAPGGDIKGYKDNTNNGSASQTSGTVYKSSSSNGSGGGYRTGSAGEGGSSYISGYAGGSLYEYTPPGGVKKSYVFLNGLMIPGVNSGDGSARIQKVSSENKLNKKITLANIKSIKDCVSSGSVSIEAMVNGKKLSTSSSTCATLNISNPTTDGNNIDEIAVWHKVGEISNHTLQVCNSSGSCIDLSKSGGGNIKETSNGLHYSLYRNNPADSTIPPGIYYIFAANEGRRVFTTNYSLPPPEEYDEDGNKIPKPVTDSDTSIVKLADITDNKYQRWYIESFTESSKVYYKILETQNYNAFQVQEGTEELAEVLTARFPYNEVLDEQKWQIEPIGNGLYYISTKILAAGKSKGNRIIRSGDNDLKMGADNDTSDGAKFIILNIEY